MHLERWVGNCVGSQVPSMHSEGGFYGCGLITSCKKLQEIVAMKELLNP